jgi:cobalt-zinc-cadmium efflux system membrane fusion protein
VTLHFPKVPKRWAAWAALLAVAIGLFALRLWRGTTTEPESKAATQSGGGTVPFLMEQQWAIRMKLAVAEKAGFRRKVESTGRVVPAFRHYAVVASAISGILAGESLPRVGQRVKKDSLIARVLDSPEAQSLVTARAMLEIEKARLEAEKRRLTESANEAGARMLLAILEADHAQRLFDRKAYSLNQYQRVQHELKVAETDYDAAKRQLEALAAIVIGDLPETRESMTDYEVKAPLSGTVVALHKQLGERVGAGEPILEIVALERVWVEAPVFERDLPRIERAARISFTTAADPDRKFEGKLVDVGAVVDERSRAATVLFEVENPDRALRIGMQANVSLETEESFEGVLVPEEALVEVEGRNFVYVLRSGEEFERREVKLAEAMGATRVVLDGLPPGERFVTRGARQIYLHELNPGAPTSHTH